MTKITDKKIIEVLVTELRENQKILVQVVNDPGNEAHGRIAAAQFNWNKQVIEAVQKRMKL